MIMYNYNNKFINFFNKITFFGMKINNPLYYNNIFKNNKNIINVQNKFNLQDKEIFNLLVSLCTRKGNSSLAYKMIIKTFKLIRKFFWFSAFFLLRLILIQSESVFILQKYQIGKREKVVPRFILFRKKTRYVLRMLVKLARSTQKNYGFLYISLAHAIIDYSLPENSLIKKNQEDNELAELSKYSLYENKKTKKKMRLFRKVKKWKKL